MSPIRIFAFVGASVAAALAAGLMFQPEAASEPALAAVEPAPPVTQASVTTSMVGLLPLPDETEARDCTPLLTLAALPAAMLHVSYRAPCAEPGSAVTLIHGPLHLIETLDAQGRLDLALPALAPEAEVRLASAGVADAAASVEVSDFDQHARLILQWTGPATLELHGFADGADWGDPGHLHAASAALPAQGFVTALGGLGPRQARVLTYPAGIDPRGPDVVAEAEVALTAESCGQPLNAAVTLLRPDHPIATGRLSVALPGCELGLGFILLPDLLPAGDDAQDFAQLR